ncbi:ubiquinone-dependent pyruvate dehydrogenase [Ancrocorticia populi]|uniref:Pyruvate dehydrogenase [ubiquinone] n=1 Tax=Ancrocorticia populi TaxID=2175228 RepID=A0A2V1K7J3_9ACTO|nr:ubiquinone-dependent pyruvate dehydrogenase [Ancrocorticia populi]PWF26588.1 ubiquinone-dependent pyruvate dehydrogenase [Ancrocorticia populi]
MATVAQNMVDTLEANGVERVYGIPGDSLNGFTDALRNSQIEWVHVRHEEAAAFAAAGEAGVTGDLAVCAGSCGPGNLHLINGLFDAQRSRVPVLAIAAHIPSAEIGSNYFQETHPQELFRECSVYVENVSTPAQMPRVLRLAMQAAVEKRGVAVVVIPGDVALDEAVSNNIAQITTARPRVIPQKAELERAASLLNDTKKVTILAGAGAADAHDEVIALADALKAPIVHALRGKQYLEHDNPFDVGMTGLLGFTSGYRAMEDSDLVLMLGTDFPYQQFYPEHALKVQVDIRGENLGRRTPLDLGIVGDVRDTAEALLPLIKPKKSQAHLDSSIDHYKKTRKKLDELATPTARGKLIHPQYVARLVNELAADDAVFLPDVGSPVVWAARYLEMNGKRGLIGSFNHGSMANAVSQAIGVQAADRKRQVVALAGDGGLAMMLGELLTFKQNEPLPVKIIVFSNSSLNFVELEMKAAGFVTYGTELSNPDFSAVARAVGLYGVRVTESDQVEGALREAFAYDGPALVEIVTDRQELSMPPTINLEQMRGFTLYTLRTVLSGRGDEILNLAKTNLRQIF